MKSLPLLSKSLLLAAILCCSTSACSTMGSDYHPKRELAKIEKEEARRNEPIQPHYTVLDYVAAFTVAFMEPLGNLLVSSTR